MKAAKMARTTAEKKAVRKAGRLVAKKARSMAVSKVPTLVEMTADRKVV